MGFLHNLRLLIFALIFFWGVSLAQPQLPEEAKALLRAGNSTVTKALITYPSPFIDQPLWRDAIAYGQAAKKLAPTHPEPYGYLGKVYSYVKFYDAAWDAYGSFRAFGGVPDDKQKQHMVELGRTLGYQFFARNDYAKALEYYLVAYYYAPTDQELNLQIARSYLGNNQTDLASAYLRKLDAQHLGEYSRLLETAANQGTYGQAASNAFERGIKQYYLGNLSDSRDSFAEATRLEPRFQKAFVWAGRVSLELSQPELALPYWEQAAALQPESADMQYFLALTKNQMRWGGNAYTFFERGMSLYNQGKMPQARIAFEQAVVQNPSFTDAWAWLGRVAYEGADYQGSYEAFSRANELANEEMYKYFRDASAQQLGLQPDAVASRPANLEQAAPVQEVRELETISSSPVPDEAVVVEAAVNEIPEAEVVGEAFQSEPEEVVAENNVEDTAVENTLIENTVTEPVEAAETVSDVVIVETQGAESQITESQPTEPVTAVPVESSTEEPKDIVTAQNPFEPVSVSGVVATPETPRAVTDDGFLSYSDTNAPNLESLTKTSLNTDPLVLLSTYYTYEQEVIQTSGAVTFFGTSSDTQTNWQAPTNYAGGTVYQRLEVSRKPSNETVTYQLCLVPNDDIAIKPACSRARGLSFSDIGVYTSQQLLSEFYQYDNIDWTRGISNLMVIVRDKDGNPVDSTFARERGQDLGLYYPMEVRYSVVVVPAGGAFRGWP
jgi:tetratricopeptide (TPR) repeat protein